MRHFWKACLPFHTAYFLFSETKEQMPASRLTSECSQFRRKSKSTAGKIYVFRNWKIPFRITLSRYHAPSLIRWNGEWCTKKVWCCSYCYRPESTAEMSCSDTRPQTIDLPISHPQLKWEIS
jgi:hypothetical protein